DFHVTGVQTCALPICRRARAGNRPPSASGLRCGRIRRAPSVCRSWCGLRVDADRQAAALDEYGVTPSARVRAGTGLRHPFAAADDSESCRLAVLDALCVDALDGEPVGCGHGAVARHGQHPPPLPTSVEHTPVAGRVSFTSAADAVSPASHAVTERTCS